MRLPIVFVHGMRVSGTMWRPVIKALPSGYPVAAPDLPGHGSRRAERFTMDAAVDAVAEAVDRVGGRALVAGLSLGGYVAIATAARLPDQVAGVVAMGCTALPEHGGWIYRRLAQIAAANPQRANRLSYHSLTRTLPAPLGRALVAGGLYCEAMPDAVAAVLSFDALAALARYPHRVWLVNGTLDHFRVDERTFLAACRDGRLLHLAGRGHLGVLADPTLPRLLLDCARLAAPETEARPAA